MGSSEPAVPLYKYQKRWVNDRSRFKIGKWARQTGKSFSTALEAVIDCVEKVTKWVFLSAGERQSKELIEAAGMHARAINLAASDLIESEFKSEDDGTVYKQLEIRFNGGSRIIGLPANPSTARGHSANVLLDEFAFHKDSRAIWRALFPTVTRGFKIRIVSTPQGKQNEFYGIWTGGAAYSKHNLTIYDAVAQGLELKDEEGRPCTPEDLERALADDEAWAQEYLVEFLDEVSAFLTYDLIGTVEDDRAGFRPTWAEALVERAKEAYKEFKITRYDRPLSLGEIFGGVRFSGDLYLGMDIGRRRDLSVIWLDAMTDGVMESQAVIELRKTPFYIQEKVLWALLELPGMRRGCIDETGIGMQLAEQARDSFGEHMVEGISFSNANKEALATSLKNNLDDLGSRIPVDQTIRQSLHSIKKYPTPTGHFRFDAERTEKTGHADHFWAKALSVMAASQPAGRVHYESLGKQRSADFRRCM